MFLVGILSWWYNDGLKGRFRIIRNRFVATSDFFSIGQLFSTLFAPYRQISADEGGSLDLKEVVSAFGNNLVSRIIGAVVRIFMIFFGAILLVVQALFGALIVVVWLLLPVAPLAGLILTTLNWLPT